MNEFDAEIHDNIQYRMQYAGPLQQDLRRLRDAAYTLQQHEQVAACEEVVAAMREIAENPADAAAADTAYDAWMQREEERIKNAQPLSDVTGQLSAEGLIGADVRNVAIEELGEVADVIFAQGDGASSYIILARGGFLGMGENHVAIPFDRLRISPDHEVLYADLTVEQIEDAPSFERGDRSWIGDESAHEQIDNYFTEG
jgi:hypothetical protein